MSRVFAMPAGTQNEITETALGALKAQMVRDSDEDGLADCAWLALLELSTRFGMRSAAVRSFVSELAKRSAG